MASFKILNTRPTAQAAEFSALVTSSTQQAIELPCLQIVPGPELQNLEKSLKLKEEEATSVKSWIVFTSSNGVRSVAERFDLSDFLAEMKIASIGEKTKQSLEEHGVKVDFSPKEQNSIGFGREFSGAPAAKLFLLRGDLANKGLVETLDSRGFDVTDLVVYKSKAPFYSNQQLRETLSDLNPSSSMIVLLSGQAAKNLKEYSVQVDCWSMLSQVPVAVIGPVTAEAVLSEGYNLEISASRPDVVALASEINDWILAKK